jgi:tRNA G37 N-methylase Trm5
MARENAKGQVVVDMYCGIGEKMIFKSIPS